LNFFPDPHGHGSLRPTFGIERRKVVALPYSSSPPSDYLPVIFGDEMVLRDTVNAQPMLQDFLSLIMRHWNAIADTLHSGEVFLPLLLQDENGITQANDWATGFLRGMEFHKEEWASLLADEEHGGWLVPIFALANEHSPDPENAFIQGAS
jgi:uncharacterized protein